MTNVIESTADRQRVSGTVDDDIIYIRHEKVFVYASNGNDLVFGSAWNDVIVGEYGEDTLYGGDGDDSFWGGGLSDLIFGEAGNDGLNGDSGNDTLDGGLGNDTLNGSIGNDTLIHVVGEGMDVINGQADNDTLELRLGAADLTAAVRADLQTLKAFMEAQLATYGTAALDKQATGDRVVLQALGIDMSTVENVKVVLDGKVVPIESLLNQAPDVAAFVAASTEEDQAYSGTVGATDADGDSLAYTVAAGPQNGTLDLDAATGAYTYTPTANWAGTDTFRVAVDDGAGHVVEQEISLTIEAVADAPLLSAVPSSVLVPALTVLGDGGNNTLVGGAGRDYIDGGKGDDVLIATGMSVIQTPLDISAALTDLDGSETLSVKIGNLPPGAVLSAGHDNGDGTWTLAPSMLAGLTLTAAVSASFTISVTATSTEANGSTATTSTDVDVLLGPNGKTMVGGGGSDNITGGTGADVIYGGGDTIAPGSGAGGGPGSSGKDGDDVIHAGAGNDTVYGNGGNDYLDGGADNDWLSGGQGNDTILGGDGNDQLYGNSGDDLLSDGAGNDTVDGSSGNDHVVAGSGDDVYQGGSGYDTLDFSEASDSMMIDISLGTATGAGNDMFSGFERVIGSSFDDLIRGSSTVDVIDGGAGHDVIRGFEGNDTLTGGVGADTFVWLASDVASGKKSAGVDTITDFKAADGDVLDLHDMLKAFTLQTVESHVHLKDTGKGTMLSVDIGGTFQDVVMLEGLHNANVHDLISTGTILV